MFCVYILADGDRGSLYTGFTANLARRYFEHLYGRSPDGYAFRKGINRLVHVEVFGCRKLALAREKSIKNLSRAAKLKLIEAHNPHWRELAPSIMMRETLEQAQVNKG